MDEKIRIGVLVSGVGSNLNAIIDAIEKKELEAAIGIVISNKKGAPALDRAKERGVKGVFLDPAEFKSLNEYEKEIIRLFRESRVEWVVLAGYLRIVTEELLSAYPGRILNIHPSLLPAFPGLRAQEQALISGVKITGCTVHLVDSGLDSGPIIVQAAVPVLEKDTVETLKERILKQEHRIYPLVLKWISEKRLKIEGRKISLVPYPASSTTELINPGESR
jgi:phosphoribosylglycinamide formyltransferase-1